MMGEEERKGWVGGGGGGGGGRGVNAGRYDAVE